MELVGAGAGVTAVRTALPPLVTGLCDDAAVFPPGLAPLPEAVRAHLARRERWFADLAGPLVLADAALPRLGPLLPDTAAPLRLAVTLPGGPAGLARVGERCAALPVELAAVEVAVPDGMGATELADRLAEGLAAHPDGAADPTRRPQVYVEVPRDARRAAVLELLAGRYRAKLRTGGVRAELYPGVEELAAVLAAAVASGVPFKATAGLHHAVRNTDPETGFEQHGFLNLLVATDVLLGGGSEADAREALAERDGRAVAAAASAAEGARAAFTSFGTCSITEPLDELVRLGLIEERT